MKYTGTDRATQFDVYRGNTYWFALSILVIASILIFAARAQSPRSHSLSPAPAHPVENLKLKAKGLLPNTAFTVFLAADHIGEIATNADGRGSMRTAALRNNRPPAVLRFASAAADDVCFEPVRDEVQGIAVLRKTASATTTWITRGRSTNDDGSIFHTINWRSIPCVSTF